MFGGALRVADLNKVKTGRIRGGLDAEARSFNQYGATQCMRLLHARPSAGQGRDTKGMVITGRRSACGYCTLARPPARGGDK